MRRGECLASALATTDWLLIASTPLPAPGRPQSYSTGLAEIFYNPPKGLLHVTTAIPRGMLDIIVGIHEGFANLPTSYGAAPLPSPLFLSARAGY